MPAEKIPTHCNYCKPTARLNQKPIITISDAAEQEPCCSRYGYIVTEEGLCFVLHGEHVMALLPASHCPMCGRKLSGKNDTELYYEDNA